jgi:hypothetical protein
MVFATRNTTLTASGSDEAFMQLTHHFQPFDQSSGFAHPSFRQLTQIGALRREVKKNILPSSPRQAFLASARSCGPILKHQKKKKRGNYVSFNPLGAKLPWQGDSFLGCGIFC